MVEEDFLNFDATRLKILSFVCVSIFSTVDGVIVICTVGRVLFNGTRAAAVSAVGKLRIGLKLPR